MNDSLLLISIVAASIVVFMQGESRVGIQLLFVAEKRREADKALVFTVLFIIKCGQNESNEKLGSIHSSKRLPGSLEYCSLFHNVYTIYMYSHAFHWNMYTLKPIMCVPCVEERLLRGKKFEFVFVNHWIKCFSPLSSLEFPRILMKI